MIARCPILLMIQALDAGGSERQLAEIARALDRSRFEPHVACFRPGGMREAELRQAGIPVLHLPITSFRSLSVLRAAAILGRYLRENRIQLVHTFDQPANYFGVLAARFWRVPVVLSSQRAFRSLRGSGARHLARLADRIVDGIVVNCQALKESLVDEDRVPPHRIHLCYNGIDCERFRPCRPPSPSPGRPLVVAYLGVLRSEKDLTTLLEAFHQLALPASAARLRIIGAGPLLDSLQRHARLLGLDAACTFDPPVASVAECLNEVDIFVLPSLSEAFSNSLLEAMACGCAVVASRVGGNPEIVDNGRTGLLFNPGDTAGLAQVLRRLFLDPSLRERLSRCAAESARERFDLRRAAAAMAGIYEAFLSGRAAGSF